MKKVLHIFNEIKFSGAEIMYASAAPIFQEKGWELFAIATGNNIGEYVEEFELKKISVSHFPLPKTFSLFNKIKYYKNLYNFMKSNKIDVLHIHRSNIYFMAIVAKFANVKTVKTQHNNFKNRKFTLPYAIFLRFIVRKFFKVKFQTIGKSIYENELYYYKNPSTRINNWYNSNLFYPPINKNEKKKLREKLNIKADSFVLITVGGCSYIKNHNDILKSIELLVGKLNLEFIHLGTGSTEKQEIELARELGIFKKVHFLGNKTNVRDYLIASDVFVMTSKFEGLGNVCLEAMACGLPLILYNVPGLRDLIENDDVGFLIEESYVQLSEKILEFSNSKELVKEKGEKALKHVNSNYLMNVSVNKMISLYTNEI